MLNQMKLQIEIKTCLPNKCEIKYYERNSPKVPSLKMGLISNTKGETEKGYDGLNV